MKLNIPKTPRKLQNSFKALINVLAPPRCMGCLVENSWLCNLCRQGIRNNTSLACIVCSKKRPRGITCRECRHKTSLAGVISVGSYGSEILRRGIHWLKFRNIYDVADPLADLLLESLRLIAPDQVLIKQAVLVPIPLHVKKLRERGFNQSSLLVQKISKNSSIPYRNLLLRNRATWTQTKLPNDLRQNNLNNAFSCNFHKSINKPLIILVDDVTTSGATLMEASYTLSRIHKGQYWGLTIARG